MYRGCTTRPLLLKSSRSVQMLRAWDVIAAWAWYRPLPMAAQIIDAEGNTSINNLRAVSTPDTIETRGSRPTAPIPSGVFVDPNGSRRL